MTIEGKIASRIIMIVAGVIVGAIIGFVVASWRGEAAVNDAVAECERQKNEALAAAIQELEKEIARWTTVAASDREAARLLRADLARARAEGAAYRKELENAITDDHRACDASGPVRVLQRKIERLRSARQARGTTADPGGAPRALSEPSGPDNAGEPGNRPSRSRQDDGAFP